MINKIFFNRAFNHVLEIEGGYINDPDDTGGATRWGISQKAFPKINIETLTKAQAKTIYYEKYWIKAYCNRLSGYNLKLEVFDTAVNMGVFAATSMLQKALNLLNNNGKIFDELKVDGIIGRKSLSAIKKVNGRVLLKTLNGLQFMRYVEITEKSQTNEKFLAGWINKRIG